MRWQMILCLLAVLVCATSGVAQSSSKQPGSTPATVTDIRKVDFLKFTYQSTLCSKEYGRKGIRKSVRVVKGEFKNKSVYFSVVDSQIIYADVTGDGSDDAIVPIDCGAIGANFSRSEVNVYTVQDGRAKLLAAINDKDLERDYRSNYSDAESYWGFNENALKVANGNLEIEVLVDGPHAAPKYIVKLEYRLSGKSLSLVGKPQRRSSN